MEKILSETEAGYAIGAVSCARAHGVVNVRLVFKRDNKNAVDSMTTVVVFNFSAAEYIQECAIRQLVFIDTPIEINVFHATEDLDKGPRRLQTYPFEMYDTLEHMVRAYL